MDRTPHLLRRLVLGAATWLLVASTAPGEELPRAKPDSVGLSADALAELKPELKKLVDDRKLVGGVALVARRGKVAYVEPFGYRDLASRTPMTEDTIFAIASMTKPITCVAVMTLVEQGKLGIDDPVGRYLPELNDLRVLGDPKDDPEDGVATVPAKRRVTVRDLLTHTSGIAYGGLLSKDPRLGRVYARARVQEPGLPSVAEQVARLATVPLAHQPGESWTYGLSHDVLGRLVEVVAAEPFDRYLHARIFAPLDMRDTSFLVPEAKRDRVATLYRSGLGGILLPLPRNYGSATYFSGGGGLYSTARDYARFAGMLAGGGALDGARVLRRETLALMTTNQIGGHKALGRFQYGLGFGLEVDPAGDGKASEAPCYFWGGIFSTYFWVDPRHDAFAVLMTQVLPTNSSGAERLFRRAVGAAIEP